VGGYYPTRAHEWICWVEDAKKEQTRLKELKEYEVISKQEAPAVLLARMSTPKSARKPSAFQRP